MPKANEVVYTATADFDFEFREETYSCKAGEAFELPRGLVEVPQMADAPGLKFQFSTYLNTVNEVKGTKEKVEMPHYLILPLKRG